MYNEHKMTKAKFYDQAIIVQLAHTIILLEILMTLMYIFWLEI